jgi:hypothetical protein
MEILRPLLPLPPSRLQISKETVMVLPTAVSLESLPLLVLERICQYIDDDSEKRHSLWAFSLTSRCCCAASAAQRFCQFQLKVSAPDELESGSRRWTEVLNLGDRQRHVRRLKVLKVMTEEERRRTGLQEKGEETGDDEDGEADRDEWKVRHYFDMEDFCRPYNVCVDCSRGGSLTDNPRAWLPLAMFISQLPGLKDLVWACGPHMPGIVLAAVQAKGC